MFIGFPIIIIVWLIILKPVYHFLFTKNGITYGHIA